MIEDINIFKLLKNSTSADGNNINSINSINSELYPKKKYENIENMKKY